MFLTSLKNTLMAAIFFFGAASLSAQATSPGSSIQLKVEVNDGETTALGMSQQQIENKIHDQLMAAGILVKPDPTSPTLLLRCKSVQAVNVVASFIQLAFMEEAELLRGKSHIQAMTWSQATLLTTPKEDFMKDTTKTIDMMVTSFIEDYKKAFATPQMIPQQQTQMPSQAPTESHMQSQNQMQMPVQTQMPTNVPSQDNQQNSRYLPEQVK